MPQNVEHAVETYVKIVEREMSQVYSRRHFTRASPNMSATDFGILKKLRDDPSIVIKPADKGGALVIMNSGDYVAEIQRQLGDVETYKKLDGDPTAAIVSRISTLIHDALENQIIDKGLSKFLVKKHPLIPVLYVLPKIHKSLTAPPGRPIVSAVDSVFSPLSIFLDRVARPYLQRIPSFILDTGDFLTKFRGLAVGDHSILVSLDVTSLYTSIQNFEGINAMKHALVDLGYSDNQLQFLLDLLDVVLGGSFFLFDRVFYTQIRGTSMGTNVAPTYANIFMSEFEENVVYKCDLFQYVHHWFRYIDDIIFVWEGTRDTLDEFLSILNNGSTSIKFTMSCSLTQINFLDTLVVKRNGKLMTDLYRKPTDKNSLLRYDSAHPPTLLNSLPRSQLVRVNRVVDLPESRDKRLEEMIERFRARGYPRQLLSRESIRINQPIIPQRRQSCGRIPFVSKYGTHTSQVKNILCKYWYILRDAYPDISEFQTIPLMSYKKGRSFRQTLVKAEFGQDTGRTPFFGKPRNGTFPCLSCSCCNAVIRGDSFVHPHSGRKSKIKGYFTCNSTYVVYLLKCPCGLIYVGETTQKVKNRFIKHRSDIRTKKIEFPVPEHFIRCGHDISQLRYQVIDEVPKLTRGGDREKLLKRRELYWIHHLNTLFPHGLNRESDLSPFL
uniref:Reverse transcriptase domain-containing protein n=2 Tax=Leptobrachium leishanense TaxID=445787 RepID=A0A8C5MB09_9ANUR